MSHPHDPNRWPEAADHDPRQSVPNERVWPSKAWHETPMPPARRGRMPWWAWLMLGLGAFALIALALLLWGAVTINAQDRAAEQAPVPAATTQAPATTQPAATPQPTTQASDARFYAMNDDFTGPQAAYLDGLLEDARPFYLAEQNTTLLAVGEGICLLLDSGDSTGAVLATMPEEYDEAQNAYVIGHAVANLCPEHAAAVRDDVTS